MTLESALHDLRSDAAQNVRLRAARFLAENGNASILQTLRDIRRDENDSWVRNALDRTIQSIVQGKGILETGQAWISIPEDPTVGDIKAVAVQSVSQTLIHEIRPLVQRIHDEAEELNDGFVGSGLEQAIGRLQEFLKTLDELQKAAGAPEMVEFELRDLIIETIESLGYDESQVSLSREEPCVTKGAPKLLGIALSNVLRNAVEASVKSARPAVINFGQTDIEAWVIVLDEGEGLPTNYEMAYEPGRTTKSKEEHFGWGLSIAQRAVISFGGGIALKPRDPVGASCEIRWPIHAGGNHVSGTDS